MIDPGLEGDLYSDKPHLYGCALSSFNVLRVGKRLKDGKKLETENGSGDNVVEEGGDEDGVGFRESRGVPEDAGKRKGWFLGRGKPDTWEWEEGRIYHGDFFNPYLDFNGRFEICLLTWAVELRWLLRKSLTCLDFTLKLPGFSLSVLGYLGGEDYLRCVVHDTSTYEFLV